MFSSDVFRVGMLVFVAFFAERFKIFENVQTILREWDDVVNVEWWFGFLVVPVSVRFTVSILLSIPIFVFLTTPAARIVITD